MQQNFERDNNEMEYNMENDGELMQTCNNSSLIYLTYIDEDFSFLINGCLKFNESNNDYMSKFLK